MMSSKIELGTIEFSPTHRLQESRWCTSLPNPDDPFIDQCKAVLHYEGLCPPPHPRWSDPSKIDQASKPALQRSNSVMNPGFFEKPVKSNVEVKPEDPIVTNTVSVTIVTEIDCSLVKPKRKWRLCACLK